MFIDMWKNFTVPTNSTGEWTPVLRNDSDSGLTNETLRVIKEELIDRIIELIENVTLGIGDGDDGGGNRDSDSDKFYRRSSDKSSQNGNVHLYSDNDDQVMTQAIGVANWYVSIGKAVDRMEQRKVGSKSGVTKILEILQALEDPPHVVLDNPMLPAITVDRGKILLDLRGIDPVVKAVDDLLAMEYKKPSATRVRRAVEDDVMQDTSRDDVDITEAAVENENEVDEEFLFNLTAALDALENAVK